MRWNSNRNSSCNVSIRRSISFLFGLLIKKERKSLRQPSVGFYLLIIFHLHPVYIDKTWKSRAILPSSSSFNSIHHSSCINSRRRSWNGVFSSLSLSFYFLTSLFHSLALSLSSPRIALLLVSRHHFLFFHIIVHSSFFFQSKLLSSNIRS